MPGDVLFLDDMDDRHRAFAAHELRWDDVGFYHVRTAAEAIEQLRARPFAQAFLDHDLSLDDIMVEPGAPSKEPTGMAVVDHIMTMEDPPLEVIVHSCNPAAAAAMVAQLEKHPGIVRVQRIPFPELMSRMRAAARRG